MSEYTVTYTELPATRRDDGYNEALGGVLVHIRPPVQLNPDVVSRYLTAGDLEPLEPYDRDFDVKQAVLLGSTPEQTTIYASIDKRKMGLAEQAANDTVKLLQFMGAQAIVGTPPTLDA
jgi:hypothetical protein